MVTATEMAASGKITRAEGGIVVFALTGTNYELHLVCPGFSGPLNVPIRGVVRVKGRKIWTVPSGGGFIEPVFGRPRTIQGRIKSLDEKSMVLHAGGPIVVEFPADDDAFDLPSGALTVGGLANVTVFPGAVFEPQLTTASA